MKITKEELNIQLAKLLDLAFKSGIPIWDMLGILEYHKLSYFEYMNRGIKELDKRINSDPKMKKLFDEYIKLRTKNKKDKGI